MTTEILEDYQTFVESMWFSGRDRPEKEAIAIAQLGMAGEVGEVTELVKKHIRDGKVIDKKNLTKELGDVLFYVTKIAGYFGITLDSVIDTNKKKLLKRKERGTLKGSGNNR